MGLIDDIRSKKPMVVPGVYDALGARMAQSVGFAAMFQTGYGTSATLFGMPDYGFVGAAETLDNARRICSAVSTPVIVDADTGYGGALNVRRLVQQLESAGAAGMFLEDQVWPKRCGHMHGKDVTTHAEYTEKLGAALDARQSRDFVIVARTDARATLGLENAIQRGVDNYKTGADVIFIEAPLSISEMGQIGSSIKAPLVANMIEGGVTPLQSAESLHGMGFSLVLYPLSVLYASAAASLRTLSELHKNGTVSSKPSDIMSFDQFNELVGLSDMHKLEEQYRIKQHGAKQEN
ncbi:MAG: isocitrate lyase/PEP mutase family protein [Cenarchaeum sp. SB0665_bin_23]|nr:isocitrate lyase/PEP mutase family protein [Cenarchaeum sp. SB0665_bin_23]MXZ93053.1 isocitrate lyase/PEP mutase family protein [Cenarchaeum sp. SB0666_bin_15]MYD58515.1 isocitrate lyase/PEP mutase family protein [Cenarchaeum sp. SB0678_bin_8]MYG32507.1 isocitrate lyase/PEP mutase family protein [Cenarchaeum sp. SB0677_bin_16]MYJ27264.1 isocitrate lyase/PEP mutase family protein [Cenarchaeum sp. SB0672_bin_9]